MSFTLFALASNLGLAMAQFPLNDNPVASKSQMQRALVLDKAERDRAASLAENAMDFAELKTKLREEKEEAEAFKERGSLMTPDGTPIPANANIGEQIIDPRTPRNFGNPFFRKNHVENNMESDLSEFMEQEAAKLSAEEIAIVDAGNATSVQDLSEVIQELPILVVRAGPNVKKNDLTRLNDDDTGDEFWKLGPYAKMTGTNEQRYVDGDLGGLYDITSVSIWHVSGQRYYNEAVEISTNGAFTGEEVVVYETALGSLGPVESSEGLAINLPEPLLGRWIRHKFGKPQNSQITAFIEMNVEGYEIKTVKTSDAWKKKKIWNYVLKNQVVNYPFFLRYKDSPHASIADSGNSDNNAFVKKLVTTSNEASLPKFEWIVNSHGIKVLRSEVSNKCFVGDDLRLRNEATGDCLVGSSSTVATGTCNADDTNQMWYFDASTRIRQSYTGKCLQRIPSAPSTLTVSGKCIDMKTDDQQTVKAEDCDGGSNQKWYYDPYTEEIKNSYNDRCLDLKTDDDIITWSCHGGNNQKWYKDGNAIKSRKNNKCIDKSNWGGNIYIHDCHGEENQRIYPSTTGSSAFYSPINVRLYTCSSSSYQRFTAMNDKRMKVSGKCLTHSNGKLSFSKCGSNAVQKFTPTSFYWTNCNSITSQTVYNNAINWQNKYLPYPCPDENEITPVGECAYVATLVEVATCEDPYTACDNPCDCFKRNGDKRRYRRCHKHCARSSVRSKVKCAKYEIKGRSLKKLLEARHFEKACDNTGELKNFHALGDDSGPSKGVF